MKKPGLYIALSVFICLTVGFLSSYATQLSVNDWYTTINKPSFNPPNWVFAPVWTLLYILMGIAAGLVWAKGFYHKWVKTALYHFVFQLLLNGLWSVVFFGFMRPDFAFFIVLALLVLIALTVKWFKVVSKPAAYLLVPYLAWVSFATVLNGAIWYLN